jgi:hypothetical protein
MSNNFPRTRCDPEEIRYGVQGTAHWADQPEAELTSTDPY